MAEVSPGLWLSPQAPSGFGCWALVSLLGRRDLGHPAVTPDPSTVPARALGLGDGTGVGHAVPPRAGGSHSPQSGATHSAEGSREPPHYFSLHKCPV